MTNETSDDQPAPESSTAMALPTKSVFSEVLTRLQNVEPRDSGESEEFLQRRRRERIQFAHHQFGNEVGKRYASVSLKTFEPGDVKARQDALERLKAFCRDLDAAIPQGRNLLLYGPVGTGKDHLLVGSLRIAIQKGYSVRWINGLDFYGRMRDRIGEDRDEDTVIRELSCPDVLGISDPLPEGSKLSDYQQQTMFRVIDRRYREMRPTWVTVNVATGKDFAERASHAIYDRLRDGALALFCNWPSYRKPAAK